MLQESRVTYSSPAETELIFYTLVQWQPHNSVARFTVILYRSGNCRLMTNKRILVEIPSLIYLIPESATIAFISDLPRDVKLDSTIVANHKQVCFSRNRRIFYSQINN